MADYEIDLGDWGAALDDVSFGCALAGLGTALGISNRRRPPLAWRVDSARDPRYLSAAIQRTASRWWRIRPLTRLYAHERAAILDDVPAGAVAQAWRAAIAGRGNSPVRLRVEPWVDAVGPYWWLAEQLGQPGVSATASVIRYAPDARRRWHEPIRVAFLEGPASSGLAARISSLGLSPDAIQVVEPAGDVDLLIASTSLPGIVDLLDSARDLDSAQGILVVGGIGGQVSGSLTQLVATRPFLRLAPWALSVSNVEVSEQLDWLGDLFGSLSGGESLDLALARGGARSSHGPGFLVADPVALDASWRIPSAPTGTSLTVTKSGEIRPSRRRYRVYSPGAMAEPPLMAEDLLLAEAPSPTIAPSREEVRAIPSAPRPLLKGRKLGDRRVPPPRPPRWIQTKIAAKAGSGIGTASEPLHHTLRPSADYQAEVWIGADGSGIRASAPIPAFEGDDRTQTLQVVFVELGRSHRTTTMSIVLPTMGSSSTCRFDFTTPQGDEFRARILVLHRNRILQSAILSAPLATVTLPAGDITLTVEADLRPGLADLEHRSTFDLAIIHNHGADGAPSGTAIADDAAFPLRLGNIQSTVDRIVAKLSEVADNPDSYGPDLKADATVQLLWVLAKHGSLLRDGLIDQRPEVESFVDAARRIQIVTADPNAVLPLEFVYDYPPPEGAAPKLCKNAARAAIDGKCDERFHEPTPSGHLKVVCPAGFWNVNRVLERQRAPDSMSVKLAGADALISNEPVYGRNRLPPLQPILFAASNKVDAVEPKSRARVESCFAKATKNRAYWAHTWDEWVSIVQSKKPSLLVLLSHTENDLDVGLPALSIESSDQCTEDLINAHYVQAVGAPPPIVLLLGCLTGVPDLSFQTFVTRFKYAGAAIVLATVATVPGAHAADVAIALVQALERASGKSPRAFGDVLSEVRRKLISSGEMMSLCLAAYGDADWQFGGSD